MTTQYRVMPRWDEKELDAIVPVHMDEAQRADLRKVEEMRVQARYHFEYFGGVPRSIFSPDYARRKVKAEITAASIESIHAALITSDNLVKGNLGAYVIHMVPDTEDPTNFNYTLGQLRKCSSVPLSKDHKGISGHSSQVHPAFRF